MFLLYNFLLTITAPIWAVWLYLRARSRKEQPNWAEKMGDSEVPRPAKGVRRIWVHAVSVGEVIAVLPILREVRSLLPDHEVILSVTTSSGHQTAREKAAGLFDFLIYFPIDVLRFQVAALSRVVPDVVAIMETELWMNFLWAAKRFDAATLLINGRISDRSFPRAKRVRFFYRSMFRYLDSALMQTSVDAERITALGARNVQVLGNCKFDQAAADGEGDRAATRTDLGVAEADFVVVVGSTRSELEEAFVIAGLHGSNIPNLKVVHAPRHLERVPELAAAIKASFGSVALRSKGEIGPYLLLDTYGELGKVYAAADVAIVGGGFDNLGGQNLIQPLAQGVPVIHGPHMQNFAEATRLAGEVGAAIEVRTSEDLARTLCDLAVLEEDRRRMGRAARELVRAHQGASRRYAEAIAEAARSKR